MISSTHDHSLSYGRYLQRCRRERELRIEDLSRELKITVDLLVAIEKEDYTKFPDEVFAKGFLRAFAKSVGANSDRVIQSYTNQISASRDSIAAEAAIGNENRMFWRKLLISSAALMFLIGLTLLLMPGPEEKEAADKVPLPKTAAPVAADAQGGTETPPPQEVAVETPPAPTSAGKLLEILTIEETWVKVIIDNQTPKEYTLRPGDRLALVAEERFNLLIGNAAGIQLFVDKTPMALQGEKGQVINIEIP